MPHGSFMDKDFSTKVAMETSRLLTDLEDVLDQSSVMRDIVDKYERLHSIEDIAGTSCRTRDLRKEVESMERELSSERYRQHLETDVN
jgi:hypothetical protein